MREPEAEEHEVEPTPAESSLDNAGGAALVAWHNGATRAFLAIAAERESFGNDPPTAENAERLPRPEPGRTGS